MNNVPVCTDRVVRKSAYGRSCLFLPTTSTILREVKCMGANTLKKNANVYHVLPEVYTHKSANCWHCCERIPNGHCVPIPRYHDYNEGVYHVFGAACSPACAKAYIIEHTSFDRAQNLNTLTKMLYDVYGITESVVETPPRPALCRFGGAFDPTKRATTVCKLVEPPFISYSMLVEEVSATDTLHTEMPISKPYVEEADTFDEPDPPALFETFLQKRDTIGPSKPTAQAIEVTPKRNKRGANATASAGPMAKFVKTKE